MTWVSKQTLSSTQQQRGTSRSASARLRETALFEKDPIGVYISDHNGMISLEGLAGHLGVSKKEALSRLQESSISDLKKTAREGKSYTVPIIFEKEEQRFKMQDVIAHMEQHPEGQSYREIENGVGFRVRFRGVLGEEYDFIQRVRDQKEFAALILDLNQNRKGLNLRSLKLTQTKGGHNTRKKEELAIKSRESLAQAMAFHQGLYSYDDLARYLKWKRTKVESAYKKLDLNQINQERIAAGEYPFHTQAMDARSITAWKKILAFMERRGGVVTVNEVVQGPG